MKSKRTLLIRIGAVAVLVTIAAVMMVIGRGHTVYIDNYSLDYEGQTYSAPYKVVVTVKGEDVAKLFKRERGMTTWIGDNFHMDLTVTEEKGGSESGYGINLKLPHNMDGVIINVPALLAGLPQDAWLSEFIPAVVEETEAPTETGDAFGLDGGFSLE